MDRIDELILDLSWYKTEADIRSAQEELAEIITESTLRRMIPFHRGYPKGYWDGMAGVIMLCSQKMDITQDQGLVKDMFEWLGDMNWPGAQRVAEVIKKFDRNLVIENIERITEVNNQDPEWLYFLTDFVVKEMVIRKEEFKNKRNYEILMKTLEAD